MNRIELFAALHLAGLVASPCAPEEDAAAPGSPWYARALLGVMGWFGGLMVLGFFGMFVSGLFNSAPGMAVLSALLFAGAFGLYRALPGNDFTNQLALAASICAQALAAGALFKFLGNNAERTVAVLVAGLQLGLVAVIPNALHRLVSTLFAVLALYMATYERELSALVSLGVAGALVAVSLTEGRLIAAGYGSAARPVWTGLALGVLAAGAAHLRFHGEATLLLISPFSAFAFGGALVVLVANEVRHRPPNERVAAIVAATILGLVSWRAPGLLAGTLVLFAAFRSGRRAMTGLALVGLLAYLSAYYYQMQLSLAMKALVLGSTGLALILAWWMHRRFFHGRTE